MGPDRPQVEALADLGELRRQWIALDVLDDHQLAAGSRGTASGHALTDRQSVDQLGVLTVDRRAGAVSQDARGSIEQQDRAARARVLPLHVTTDPFEGRLERLATSDPLEHALLMGELALSAAAPLLGSPAGRHVMGVADDLNDPAVDRLARPRRERPASEWRVPP